MRELAPTTRKGEVAVAGDNPLALLPPQLASSVEPRYRTWTDERYGYDCELVGYSLPESLTTAQARQVLERYEAALPPASIREIGAALSRVRVLTKGRNLDDADAELTVAAFAEELAEYPGQLVLETLRYWPRRSEWFPTWQELQELLRLRGGRILAMREALRSRAARRESVSGEMGEVVRGIADSMRMPR